MAFNPQFDPLLNAVREATNTGIRVSLYIIPGIYHLNWVSGILAHQLCEKIKFLCEKLCEVGY